MLGRLAGSDTASGSPHKASAHSSGIGLVGLPSRTSSIAAFIVVDPSMISGVGKQAPSSFVSDVLIGYATWAPVRGAFSPQNIPKVTSAATLVSGSYPGPPAAYAMLVWS